ncbi:hypothetical protein HNY73_005038 [Argiope bruennichi]|uniref:Uncharacterized protein n=1 Tax=Argiope bruennichi TaxID=94029 RepID=A0A8T0FF85_ARGBR|nr:hypothetical protein HNY73_005038 [Argiope bruennichi]
MILIDGKHSYVTESLKFFNTLFHRSGDITRHTEPQRSSLPWSIPAESPYLETWWNGPNWLAQISDAWPVQNILTNEEKLLMDIEARQVKNQTLCTSTIQTLIDISHFSSYAKLLRITAWIYRFLNNCKGRQH